MTRPSLVARRPAVPTAELLGGLLVPPPQFAHVSFDSYLADPAQPSQAAAVAALRAFAAAPTRDAPRRWGLGRGRRRGGAAAPPEARPGVYLDGGFGVGKTHLLAALWHEVPGPKSFGTFVEYTNLIGALGFNAAVAAFAAQRLVCIDEFELDDPGDTVLMSTFLGKLVDQGVRLAATSNTLPDRLGEGRFAAEDFLREIQGLSAHFEVLRIEGEDYRHRGHFAAAPVWSEQDLTDLAATTPDASLDDFEAVLAQLRTIHPSAYGALVRGLSLVCLRGVQPLVDQADALRLVVLVDRLYDAQVAIAGSGHSLTEVFPADMLAGGYRKKYYRTLSRLGALAVQP